MLEKLKFAWYWVMVFLFGKDGGINAGSSETVEKDVIKDVSKVLEDHGYKVVGEVALTTDEQLVIKEVKTCKPLHKSNKLTMDQARAIRADSDIKTIKELAAEYSVSTDTIRRIIKGDTYKDVK